MDRNFLTLLGKMTLFLASLTLLSPCRAHLPLRLMVVATKFAGNFLCRPPVGRWSNSATSSLRHTSMQRFRVRSLILSNFLVVCSFLIPSTIRSRIKLSRKQSQKLHVLARFLYLATKLSTDSIGSLSRILKQYRS